MNLPQIFHLKCDNELLAVLKSCNPSGEMFWQICKFKPEEAFQEFEPLFQEASAFQDMAVFERNYDQLAESGVILFDVENNTEIKDFILHIDGEQVTLRYAEQPDHK